MTTDVLTAGSVTTRTARVRLPAVVVLGWREARRILTSPVFVVMALLLVATSGIASVDGGLAPRWPSGESWYVAISFFVLLYAGLLTYAAAHLVASSARRTHADRLHEATPLGARGRSGALCLGVLFGPAAVALGLTIVLAFLGADLVIVENEGALGGAELAQLPLLVLGAGLFGVMTATWLRFPGSLPLGLLTLVFGTAWLVGEQSGSTVPWFAPYTSAESWLDTAWTYAGSHAWHAVYLLGLCGLACCATMLRERTGRRRWVLVTVVVLAATVVAGAAQV